MLGDDGGADAGPIPPLRKLRWRVRSQARRWGMACCIFPVPLQPQHALSERQRAQLRVGCPQKRGLGFMGVGFRVKGRRTSCAPWPSEGATAGPPR